MKLQYINMKDLVWDDWIYLRDDQEEPDYAEKVRSAIGSPVTRSLYPVKSGLGAFLWREIFLSWKTR